MDSLAICLGNMTKLFLHGGERREYNMTLQSKTYDLSLMVKGCQVNATLAILTNVTLECDNCKSKKRDT